MTIFDWSTFSEVKSPRGSEVNTSLSMKNLTFLLIFCFQNTALGTTQNNTDTANRKEEELRYRRLFMPEYQRKLLEADIRGAQEAVFMPSELGLGFVPENDSKIQTLIFNLEEGEAVTEEGASVPKYETLQKSKLAFGIPDDKTGQPLGNKPLSSVWSSSFILGKPLYDADSGKLLRERAESLSNEREKFIDDHPKWFVKKQYYNNDLFGLGRTRAIVEKKGEGVCVMVMDKFEEVMPLALKGKCTNAHKFTGSLENYPKAENHGVAVTSVLLDTEIGVAPGATFVAADFHASVPKFSSEFKEAPTDVPNIIVCTGNLLQPHHLKQIDECIQRDDVRFTIKISENQYRLVDASNKPVPQEEIINFSISYSDSIGDGRTKDATMWHLILFAAMILRFVRAGKLIVWAAGNESMVQSGANAYSLMKALAEYKPGCFINVLALSSDGTTLSGFTNQPGDHPIQNCSLAAPGQDVPIIDLDGTYRKGEGTSYAAPYITGAVALLKSNFPEVPVGFIAKSLLFCASPVVMRSTQSRHGETPVVIRSCRSGELKPGLHMYYNPDGKEKSIEVTQQMINRGKAKYGTGIINIAAALKYLEDTNKLDG